MEKKTGEEINDRSESRKTDSQIILGEANAALSGTEARPKITRVTEDPHNQRAASLTQLTFLERPVRQLNAGSSQVHADFHQDRILSHITKLNESKIIEIIQNVFSAHNGIKLQIND